MGRSMLKDNRPPEYLDVYDEQGNRTGTALRSEVHARGLWHQTFHCWLVRRGEDGKAYAVFQRRSADKDTNPGCFDITVAGHLAAGESVRDAAREMEEEIGWSVPFEELVPFGIVKEESEGEVAGRPVVDREISHVFGCVADVPPAGFRLQREEVAGLYEAEADLLIALMRGEVGAVAAQGAEPDEEGDALRPASATVTADSFVPRDRGYYIRVFRFLRELAFADRGGYEGRENSEGGEGSEGREA